MKVKRPEFFYSGPYMWVIKYFKSEAEDAGKTFYESKEVHIFTKGYDEAFIKDTLLHELEHVICENIFSSLKVVDEDTVEDVEEAFILLTTPRRMLVYQSNPDLIKYLFPNEGEK